MLRRRFRVENIHVRAEHRKPDMEKVDEIAESISRNGLWSAPAVRMCDGVIEDGEIVDGVAVLIYGHHRLLALKKLGVEHVECDVHDVDEDTAIIMEADENLARSEIQGAARVLSVAAREEAWLRKNGNSTVQNLDGRKVGYKTPPLKKKLFATETAEIAGISRSAIYQDKKRFTALGRDFLRIIEGTSLSSGVEMDALMELPEAERQALALRAASGERVTARPAPPAPPVAAEDALTKIMSGMVPRFEREHDNSQEVWRQAREAIDLFGLENMPFFISLLEGSPKRLAAEIRGMLR